MKKINYILIFIVLCLIASPKAQNSSITIAIQPFTCETLNNERHLSYSPAFPEVFEYKLSVIPGINIINKQTFKRQVAKLSKSRYTSVSDIILLKAGKKLSLDYIITGKYEITNDDKYYLIIRILNPLKDRLVASFKSAKDEVGFQDKIAKFLPIVLEKIQLDITDESKNNLQEPVAKNIKAFRYFAEALYQETRFGGNSDKKAKKLYKKAIKIDKDFLLAKLNKAFLLEKQKELLDAEELYKEVLSQEPQNIFSVYKLALFYYRKYEYPKAEKYFNRVLETNPDHVETCYKLARIYAADKNIELAKEQFLKVIENDPKRYEAYIQLSNLYKTQNEITEAINILNKISIQLPTNWEIYYSLGELYLLVNNKNMALKKFSKAKYYNQKEGKIFNKIGEIHFASGKLKKAEVQFAKAIKNKPNLLDAYANMAKVQIRRGRYKGAQKYLSNLLAIDDNHVDGCILMGKVSFKQKKYKDAIKYLEFGTKQKPKDKSANLILAETYLLSGDSARALSIVEKVISMDESDIKALKTAQKISVKTKDFDRVIKYTTLIIDLDPKQKHQYKILGKAFLAQDKNSEAIEAFTIYNTSTPDDATVYYNLGKLHNKLENFDKALFFLNKAVRTYPKNDSILVSLADMYIVKRNINKAIIYLTKAVFYNAKNIEALQKLGFAYIKVKNYKKAEKNLALAIALNKNLKKANRELGFLRIKLGSTKDAIENLEKASINDPQDFEVLYLLAKTYQKIKVFPKSINAYKRAIELKPEHIKAITGLAVVFESFNKTKNALTEYNRILEINSDHVFALLRAGSILSKTKKINEAIELYFRIMEIESKNFKVSFSLANLLLKADRADEAKNEFIRYTTLTRKPKHEAYFSLANIYKIEENYSKSIMNASKAYRLDPKNLKYIFFIATQLIDNKKYKKAELYFDKVIKIDRKNSKAYYFKGKCILGQGKDKATINKAIVELKRSILNNPKTEYMETLINSYIRIKQYSRAAPLCRQYLKKDSTSVIIRKKLATIYLKTKSYSLAEKQINILIQNQPENEKLHFKKGIALYEQKRYNDAIDAFRNAINIKGDYAIAHKYLGDIYFNMKNYEMATMAYEETISFGLMEKDVLFKAGLANEKNSSYDRAVDLLREALNIKTGNNQEIYIHLGLNCIYAEQYKDAVKYLGKAARKDPKNNKVLELLAKAHLETKNYKNAMIIIKKRLGKRDKTADTFLLAGKIYYHTKQNLTALIYLKKSLKQNAELAETHYYMGLTHRKIKGKRNSAIASFIKYINIGGDIEQIPEDYQTDVIEKTM